MKWICETNAIYGPNIKKYQWNFIIASKSFCLHENNSTKVLLLCVIIFCSFVPLPIFIVISFYSWNSLSHANLFNNFVPVFKCDTNFCTVRITAKSSDCVCEFAKYSYESSLYVVTHKEKKNFSLVICLGYSRFLFTLNM